MKDYIVYFTQAAFSGIGILFCMTMMINGKDTTVYLPIMTGLLSYWLPNPKLNPSSLTVTSDPKLNTPPPLIASIHRPADENV